MVLTSESTQTTSYTVHETPRGPILEWDGVYFSREDERHKKHYVAKLTFTFHSFLIKPGTLTELLWPDVAPHAKKAFDNVRVEANSWQAWIGAAGPEAFLHKNNVQTGITFVLTYGQRKLLPATLKEAMTHLKSTLNADEKTIRAKLFAAVLAGLNERIEEVEAEQRWYKANALVANLASAATDAAKDICRFEDRLAALVAEVEEERKLQAKKIREKAKMNEDYLKSHHVKVKEAALKHIEDAFQPVIHDGFGETKTPVTKEEVQ